MSNCLLGSFRSSLAALPAPALGAQALKLAVEKSTIPGEEIKEVLMGNVLSAGMGQAPARQVRHHFTRLRGFDLKHAPGARWAE